MSLKTYLTKSWRRRYIEYDVFGPWWCHGAMSGAVLLPGQVDGEPLASGEGKYVEIISQVWFDGTAVGHLHHLHGEQAADGDARSPAGSPPPPLPSRPPSSHSRHHSLGRSPVSRAQSRSRGLTWSEKQSWSPLFSGAALAYLLVVSL